MARELASSFSYYAEKLEGGGVGTVFVRAVSPGLDEVVPVLERIGVSAVRPIDAASSIDAVNGSRFDPLGRPDAGAGVGLGAGKDGVSDALLGAQPRHASVPEQHADLDGCTPSSSPAVVVFTVWNVRTEHGRHGQAEEPSRPISARWSGSLRIWTGARRKP